MENFDSFDDIGDDQKTSLLRTESVITFHYLMEMHPRKWKSYKSRTPAYKLYEE